MKESVAGNVIETEEVAAEDTEKTSLTAWLHIPTSSRRITKNPARRVAMSMTKETSSFGMASSGCLDSDKKLTSIRGRST